MVGVKTLSAPMVQFLEWLRARPRTYTETMEGWRTSCPRLALWEDAQEAGYVRLAPGDGDAIVTLTERGHAVIAAS